MLEMVINLVVWGFIFWLVIMAGVEIVKQYLLQSRNKHVVIDMDSQGNKLILLEDGREYWVGYPKTLRGFILAMRYPLGYGLALFRYNEYSDVRF